MKNYNSINILIISMLLVAAISCADRIVTDQDFRYDLNRPAVSHATPVEGAVNVPHDITINVWFSKVMNEGSIEANFYLYPIISMDSLNALSFDPSDSDIVYAAGTVHGIFRSESGGEQWQWMTKSMPYISATSVLVGDNESYVLAGTTDGLYLSKDQGGSWELSQELDNQIINSLASDPSDRNIIYAAVGTEGVYKSEDGGETWQFSSTGLRSGVNFPDVTVDPINNNSIYVTTENDFVYKSVNGAETWQQIRVGLASRSYSSIVVSPDNPDLLLAGSLDEGAYISTNGGENWEFASDEITDPVHSLAFDPVERTIIYAGTELGMYRSTNHGVDWMQYDVFEEEGAVSAIASPNSGNGTILASLPNGPHRFNTSENRFIRSAEVILDNIIVAGEKEFEIWSDTLTIESPLDYHMQETEMDTTIFSPFVPTRALQAWEAQGRTGEPPVEIDPDATKFTYRPAEMLINDFRYRVLVRGSFEDGGNIPREIRGAEDLKGNSLETDSRRQFRVEP